VHKKGIIYTQMRRFFNKSLTIKERVVNILSDNYENRNKKAPNKMYLSGNIGLFLTKVKFFTLSLDQDLQKVIFNINTTNIYIKYLRGILILCKIKFEWDKKKAETNFEKHKVSFELAKEIFDNPQVLTFTDERFDYGEDREIAIGKVEDLYLSVVFTVRGEKIRLISARIANIKERRAYDDYFKKKAARDTKKNE
jgi:uncharacterized protein